MRYCWLVLLVLLMFTSCGTENANSGKVESKPGVDSVSPAGLVAALREENTRVSPQIIDNLAAYPLDIQRIIRRGTIIFAMVATDQKPFFYIDQKSQDLIGLDVEIALAIANKLGVRAEFNRQAQSFDAVVVKVAKGEADVAISKLSRTLKRAQLVRFTQPYIVFRQALLFNRLELAKFTTEEKLPTFVRSLSGRVGVIEKSSYLGYAQSNFPGADIVQFPAWEQAVGAVVTGTVLAVYRDELEILKVNASRKDAGLLTKAVFLNDKQDPIAMAVAQDAPMLEAWLNIFLDEYLLEHAADLAAERLVARHFGEDK
jgi:ABC-type amino acid transport substrate-binding protein